MKRILKISLISSGAFLMLAAVAFAVNPFDIQYPVVELGSCASQQECRVYCDNPENQTACIDFAEHSGLISTEEANRIREKREFREEVREGPGGCTSPQQCDAFCQGPENMEVCLAFSVKEGFMDQAEADRIIAQANRGGPGGCQSREECDAFCENPDNNRICLAFVVEEGNITREEADFLIKQMERHRDGGPRPEDDEFDEAKAVRLLEEMAGPGGCEGMDECDAYCSTPENNEECMNFAVEHGLIPPEQVERMKKFMNMAGPGGCQGPEECDVYCSLEANRDECFNFGIESGMLPPEEVERMKREMEIVRKLDRGFSGPGGCQGPEECNVYCSNPDHTEECMRFSEEQGLIDRHRGDTMRERTEEFREEREIMEGGEHGSFFDFDSPSEDMMMYPPTAGFGPDGSPPGEFIPMHDDLDMPSPPYPYPTDDMDYPTENDSSVPPHEGYDQYPREMMYPEPTYMPPPDGAYPEYNNSPPPPGEYDITTYPEYEYIQPTSGEFSPPPPEEEFIEPTTSNDLGSFLGTVLETFLGVK